MQNSVVVLSGGLDSTILTYDVVHRGGTVFPITFYYGQKQHCEIERAKTTCKKLNLTHKVVNLSFLGDLVKPVSANIQGTDVDMPNIKEVLGDPQPVTYVPNRNMILLSIATSYAEVVGADIVFVGLQTHDQYGYWDTSTLFVDEINKVNQLNRQKKIVVKAPYGAMDKTEEIKIGEKLGVDYYDTFTCYNPQLPSDIKPYEIPRYSDWSACGQCPSCAERIQAFLNNGLRDPLPYTVDIDWGF